MKYLCYENAAHIAQCLQVAEKHIIACIIPRHNFYYKRIKSLQQSPAYNAQAPPQQQPQKPQPQTQPHYQPQQTQPQYQQQQNLPQYQQQNQPQHNQQSGYCEGRKQETTGLSKLIPFGPGVAASPAPPSTYRQGPQSPQVAPQHRQPNSRWAPVPAPLSPQVLTSNDRVRPCR